MAQDAVTGAQLLAFYRQMRLARVLDDRILELRAAGEFVGAAHPCAGHEAIAAGVCGALVEGDVVVSYYRGLAHAVALGADPRRVLAERGGSPAGYCRGRAGEFLVARDRNLAFTAAIVGGGVPLAAGAAFAAQVNGAGTAAVAFFGDGALGAGVVHETMNIASAQRLPLVLVCENNLYQDHTRAEDVFPDSELARVAEGHRIPAEVVDGNDVAAVHAAARAALARARAAEGPTFIEARTYLLRFHLQFDRPPPEYRPPAEAASWAARDPLDRALALARAHGVADAELERADRDAERAVAEAVDYLHAAPAEDPGDVLDHVWVRAG